MPNLWSTTTQKLSEFINGPRTKDTDYELKLQEFKSYEVKFHKLKDIFQNYFKNTHGYKNVSKDICTTLVTIYNESSVFWPLVKEINGIFEQSETLYDQLIINICEIEKTFDYAIAEMHGADKLIELRKNSRMEYDHYDEKLEKLVHARLEKHSKNIAETEQEIKKFERV